MRKTVTSSQKHSASADASATDRAAQSPANPRPDRINTKCVAAHLPEEMYWQLKALSVEERTDMQSLLAAAINDLFKKFKKSPIIAARPTPVHHLSSPSLSKR